MNTVKIKSSALDGLALRWATVLAKGYQPSLTTGQQRYERLSEEERADVDYANFVRESKPRLYWDNPVPHSACPDFAGDPAQLWLIIKRARISIRQAPFDGGRTVAFIDVVGSGNNRVIARQVALDPALAALRCFVTSKLGEEIEIPAELAQASDEAHLLGYAPDDNPIIERPTA